MTILPTITSGTINTSVRIGQINTSTITVHKNSRNPYIDNTAQISRAVNSSAGGTATNITRRPPSITLLGENSIINMTARYTSYATMTPMDINTNHHVSMSRLAMILHAIGGQNKTLYVKCAANSTYLRTLA